ncbi:unnamed protein product [Microthlaspi erraticum]|uniref:Uncharacterized protein n=1 Tax=Microthlaspi erraticum TaxID=1685480 RepID=A0A6D2JF11_9BRAS|nr:unnamed protein product [Microthlaspi erraticum]
MYAHSSLSEISQGRCNREEKRFRVWSFFLRNVAQSSLGKWLGRSLRIQAASLFLVLLVPMTFNRSLCDLGAGVSVMPLTVAKRLGFEKYQKCDVSLVLADRSVRIPVRGKIELNFGDDFKLSFDIKRSMKKPTIDGQLFWVFWSIWSIWDVRSRKDLVHGRSSTGYAKEEGGSHLEDQLDHLLDQPVEFLNSTGQASTRSS